MYMKELDLPIPTVPKLLIFDLVRAHVFSNRLFQLFTRLKINNFGTVEPEDRALSYTSVKKKKSHQKKNLWVLG